MKMVNYHGARYLAAYVGTSLTSIHNWRNAEDSGFPEPVAIISNVGRTRATYGWAPEQLPSIRDWCAKRLRLDEATAEARWKAIDSALCTDQPASGAEENPNQIQLFTIPKQRDGKEVA